VTITYGRSLLFLISLCLTACANQPTYIVDFSEGTDFSQYQNYRWYDDVVETERGEYRHYNSSDKRVRDHVNAELEKKGLFESRTLEPDFLINYSKSTQDRVSIDSFSGYPQGMFGSVGAGTYGTGMSIGYSSGPSVREYREGTVVLDVIDAKSMEIVWRGIAEGRLSKDRSISEKNHLAAEVCGELLADFPPAPGAQP
jgi:hypothetical protein